MLLELPIGQIDYQLLDTGNGLRLEKWSQFSLIRPDPQIIWQKNMSETEWQTADATFISGSGEDKGHWQKKTALPEKWKVNIGPIKLWTRLTPFKHTGIFPEQASNWDWMIKRLKDSTIDKNQKNNKLKILNLFAYTGGASIALATSGCFVTHVDASKPSLALAKENLSLNNLPADSVRWILDDAAKFVNRELKRGQTYDGIIMDPPAFGHSPSGKTWKFNRDLPDLLKNCAKLLSRQPKFFLINGYATNSSALALNNILSDVTKPLGGKIEFGELCLKEKSDNKMISTGIFARWSN